jgi:hypothetical protein
LGPGKLPHSVPKGKAFRIILIMTSPDKVGYFNYGPEKLPQVKVFSGKVFSGKSKSLF